MAFRKLITGCALMVLSCSTTEAVDITVTAVVPEIFDLLNNSSIGNGLDKSTVNLLKADGTLSDETDRKITFKPTHNGQAKVKVSSAHAEGTNCRVHCDGANLEDVAYTVKIRGGNQLTNDVLSDAIDFQKEVGFCLVFEANATDFTDSGKTYTDTLTVTFEAP